MPASEEHSLWIEKYRPTTFAEVKGHTEIVKRLEAFVQHKNIPHLLFSGPAGVGKSTLSLVIARQLFGDDWQRNFLELNASDSRGIDTVRGVIKDFCRTKAIMGDLPKIIFLDEADALTKEAQQSLRRIMEQYSKTARFILSCVTPDTKISLKDEVEVKISDVRHMQKSFLITTINPTSMMVEKDTSFMYMESNPLATGKKVILLRTDTGRTLRVTDDHLIFTKRGWKRAGKLTHEDYLAILPVLEDTPPPNYMSILDDGAIEKSLDVFEKRALKKKVLGEEAYYQNLTTFFQKKLINIVHALYHQNFSMSTISKKIKKVYNLELSVTQTNRILKNQVSLASKKIERDLNHKGLLPLATTNPSIGILARILGYLFGDGHLADNRNMVAFTGDYPTLNLIKNEVNELGFKTTNITSVKKTVVIRGRKTSGVSHSFYTYEKSFWVLLKALGMPPGNKCKIAYFVPKWIVNGPKFIKREFLRGFFDAEMSKPIIDKKSATRFGNIALTQHKIRKYENDCFIFLEQIRQLLMEFKVESFIKKTLMPYIRKDGYKVTRFELHIRTTNKNLLQFFKTVNFYYDTKKRRLSRIAHEYLKYKQHFVEKLQCSGKNAAETFSKGNETKIEIASRFGISVSLLTNQINNKYVNIPRNFITFEAWSRERAIPNSELVWNRLESIEDDHSNLVCDISTAKFHNFIGNGIVLHNCNYSSKIIDPIQSRCTIFRFKPLQPADMKELILAISKREDLKIDDKTLEAIIHVSRGDVRRAENMLQSCSAVSDTITEELVYEIVSAAHPEEMQAVLLLALEGNFLKAREKLLDVMLRHGLAGEEVVKQIQEQIWHLPITDQMKMRLVEKCGEIEFRMVEGSDEFVQIEALLANVALAKP